MTVPILRTKLKAVELEAAIIKKLAEHQDCIGSDEIAQWLSNAVAVRFDCYEAR